MNPTNENTFQNAEDTIETSDNTVSDNLSASDAENYADFYNDVKVVFKNKTTFGQETTCTAKTELLKLVDGICRENGIQYFAIANLLTSCVHYQDFLPDEAYREWDLGLLRSDYDRLLEILSTIQLPRNVRFLWKNGKKDIYPREVAILEIAAEIDNLDIHSTHLFHIRLLPFDKLPANHDVRTAFFEEIQKETDMFRTIKKWRTYNSKKQRLRTYIFNHVYYGKRSLSEQYKKLLTLATSYNNDPEAHEYARIVFGRTKVISEDQLFPLQELPFRDMKVMCPKDVTIWTPVFDEELDFQVKSIQKVDLDLLKRFDEVCREIGVGYFVCGGTMLGYMRHGGFIPWDDDVDVAMLREDYDRFFKEAPKYFDDEKYFIQTRESDPKIPYLFSKIRLNNTEYITAYNEYRDFHKGICLDIFPFDYLPNDEQEQKAFIKTVNELSKKHNEISNGQTPVIPNELPPRNAKEKQYQEATQKKRDYYNSMSLADSQAAYIKEATKYNATAKENGLTTVASFVPSYTYINLEDLLPYQDGDFNGIRVMVPKRPDVFLTMQYGDYMQLPPKHMQVAHKLLRWSDGVNGSETSKDKKEV